MPVFTLQPFPGTSCPAVKSITVAAKRSGTNLDLAYILEGDIAALKVPAPSAAVPAEKLWEHTCFELFFTELGEDLYHEYNFSPSTAWNHYQFSDYREPAEGAKVRPAIRTTKTATSLRVDVSVQLATDEEVDAALAAVIETNDGKLTYWALAHTNPDEPDFHDPQAFVATL